jgi:hypothetical protein
VDGAVEVVVADSDPFVMEPGEVQTFAFVMNKGKRVNVTMRAALVANPAVSDSTRCHIAANQTTDATINASAAGTAISIDVSKPAALAALAREAGVVMASLGGFTSLLLAGAVLGGPRGRRRRPDHQGQSNEESVHNKVA